MYTPWGNSQNSTVLADGITSVDTASHGGYHLDDKANAKVKMLFPDFRPFAGEHWYEEDCDWAIVALAFPELFSDENLRAAINTVNSRYFPLSVQKFLASDESKRIRDLVHEWETAHAHLWLTGNMGTSSKNKCIWVSLHRIGDNAEKQAMFHTWPAKHLYSDQELADPELVNI